MSELRGHRGSIRDFSIHPTGKLLTTTSTCPPRLSPPPSSALCRVETPGLLVLLLPGPVVISQRETGLHTGRPLEVRTRLVQLALDPHPWSSVEDLDVASLPSSSSVTYERNVIGCFAIFWPYVALQAISHWFKRLILQ